MKKTLAILLAILCVQCCTICGEIFRGGVHSALQLSLKIP